jgi:hypothetical protein
VDDDRFRRRAPAPDDGHGLIRRTDSRSLGFGLGLMASVADELGRHPQRETRDQRLASRWAERPPAVPGEQRYAMNQLTA